MAKALKSRQREKIYVQFGKTVRHFRELGGLTQAELGHHTDRQRSTIANIEAGRQRIYLEDLILFAKVFKIEPDLFLCHVLGN